MHVCVVYDMEGLGCVQVLVQLYDEKVLKVNSLYVGDALYYNIIYICYIVIYDML